jgi:hypothetical protein
MWAMLKSFWHIDFSHFGCEWLTWHPIPSVYRMGGSGASLDAEATRMIPHLQLHQRFYSHSDKYKRLKKTPWPESASELYRPSDRRLSAKLVSTFADRGCHVVSVTDPYSSIVWFLDRSSYFFFQVVPQLYSQGWVDPVPDPLLLRKSGSVGNRSSGSVARNSDH